MKKVTKKISSVLSPHLFAVGFGSGLSPYFPGTIGSLVAIIFWLPMNLLAPLFYWFIIIMAVIFGVFICQKTADELGSSDPGCIVWDEFVGMWITLFFIPHITWLWILVAFLLFRFFDIAKPWPIRWFDEQVSGGFGIMVDDIVAGFLSGIVLVMLNFFI